MTHAITSDATPVNGAPYEVARNEAVNPVMSPTGANVPTGSGTVVWPVTRVSNAPATELGTTTASRHTIVAVSGSEPSVLANFYNLDGYGISGPARWLRFLIRVNIGGAELVPSGGQPPVSLVYNVWNEIVIQIAEGEIAAFKVRRTSGTMSLAEVTYITEVSSSPVPQQFFYGGTPGTANDTYTWAGTANASASILTRTPVLIPSVTNPLAVAGYATKRESRNVVSDTLDGGIGVAHFAPRLRKGTLTTVYETADEAWKAYAMYGRGQHFTLYPDDAPAATTRFVLDGALKIAQDDDDAAIWFVDIDYQEVPA